MSQPTTTSPNPQLRGQTQRIFNLLVAARGAEVPLPVIVRCAAQYNSCIHRLRKLGLRIINRTEIVNGVKHSWYRLELGPPPEESLKQKAKTRERGTGSSPSQSNMELFGEPPAPKPAQSATIWRDPEMGGMNHGR